MEKDPFKLIRMRMNIFLRGQKYVIRGILCNYKILNGAFQQISSSGKKGNENKIGGNQ